RSALTCGTKPSETRRGVGHAAASGGLGGRDPSRRPAGPRRVLGRLPGRSSAAPPGRVPRPPPRRALGLDQGRREGRRTGLRGSALAARSGGPKHLRPPAGRAAARGERAALSRALRGGTQRRRGDRRLLSVNHRATQLLGVPASELVGRPVLALFAETPAGRS